MQEPDPAPASKGPVTGSLEPGQKSVASDLSWWSFHKAGPKLVKVLWGPGITHHMYIYVYVYIYIYVYIFVYM